MALPDHPSPSSKGAPQRGLFLCAEHDRQLWRWKSSIIPMARGFVYLACSIGSATRASNVTVASTHCLSRCQHLRKRPGRCRTSYRNTSRLLIIVGKAFPKWRGWSERKWSWRWHKRVCPEQSFKAAATRDGSKSSQPATRPRVGVYGFLASTQSPYLVRTDVEGHAQPTPERLGRSQKKARRSGAKFFQTSPEGQSTQNGGANPCHHHPKGPL